MSATLPRLIRAITVEPSVFFFGISVGLVIVSNYDLYFDLTCAHGSELFGNGTVYPEEVCADLDLPDNFGPEAHVEYQISRLAMVSGAIKAIPCILVAAMAGPWSDRFGRAAVISLPLLGFVICDGIFILLSEVKNVGPDYILFETIHDLLGGLPLLMMGAFAHIVDVSTKEHRTSRMAILEAALLLGLALGNLIGAPIYSFAGHSPIYVLSLIVIFIGILTVPFFVKLKKVVAKPGKVAIKITDTDDPDSCKSTSSKFKALFQLKHIKQTFSIGFKENSFIIWLLLIVFFLLEMVTQGEKITDIMYVRQVFPLDTYGEFSTWWNTFYAIFIVWGIFCLVLMVPVLKQVYNFSDPAILLICAVGSFFRSLVFLLATDRGHLYIGSFLDLFNLAGLVAIRSSLSSLVDDKDIGKIFGLAAVVQALASAVAPLYHLLFEATEDYHLGMAHCINATVFIIVALIAIYLIRVFKRKRIGMGVSEMDLVETDEKTIRRLSSVCVPNPGHDLADVVLNQN